MTVKVSVCSVAQLFASLDDSSTQNPIVCGSSDKNLSGNEKTSVLQGKLLIPEYQRAYLWGSEQLQKLLHSIREHFSQPAGNPPTSPPVPYYLGSLILHRDGQNLNIIDGQQRVTSLALMAHLKEQAQPELRFTSPLSQENIRRNLDWLKQNTSHWEELIDFHQLQFTLVVTDNQDQAYHFFETHNTDGVRLTGDQIIKAHHLRAIAQRPSEHENTVLGDENKALEDVNNAAKKWERLQELPYLIQLLLKGRFWKQIQGNSYPSVRNPRAIRDSIVDELANKTASKVPQDNKSGDIGFANLARLNQGGESKIAVSGQYYDLRQPLNAGWNTLNYLDYFTQLKSRFLVAVPENQQASDHKGFHDFYCRLILKVEGCGFIKPLYDTALLLYISQFGDARLEVAAKKLFRVIYSWRFENQRAVKENSIPSFIRQYPVLDWITISFTPHQLFNLLDGYTLTVDSAGLGPGDNSVKKRALLQVADYFGFSLRTEEHQGELLADTFKAMLDQHITTLPESSMEFDHAPA